MFSVGGQSIGMDAENWFAHRRFVLNGVAQQVATGLLDNQAEKRHSNNFGIWWNNLLGFDWDFQFISFKKFDAKKII